MPVQNPALEQLRALQAQEQPFTGLLGPLANVATGRRRVSGKQAERAEFEAGRERTADTLIASGVSRQDIGDDRFDALTRLGVSDPQTFNAEVDAIQASRPTPVQAQQLRKARLSADIEQLNFDQARGIGLAPERLLNVTNQLRDERRADLAPHVAHLNNFTELAQTIQFDTGPASVATLFKFISGLDDSVVRDSEAKMVGGSTGPVRELVNWINRIEGGGILSEPDKQEILQVSQSIAETVFNTATEVNKRHDVVAGQFSERFMVPGIANLTQSAAFDPNQQFGQPPTPPARVEPPGEITEAPEGFSVP